MNARSPGVDLDACTACPRSRQQARCHPRSSCRFQSPLSCIGRRASSSALECTQRSWQQRVRGLCFESQQAILETNRRCFIACQYSPIGTVTVHHWQKPRGGQGDLGACALNDDLIANLDPNKDVLMFPLKEATLAEDFAWGADAIQLETYPCEPGHESTRRAGPTGRKNLVVLEASWGGGKTMARTIVQRRHRLGLEPIPCVTLRSNIVGKYWKVRFSSAGAGLWFCLLHFDNAVRMMRLFGARVAG